MRFPCLINRFLRLHGWEHNTYKDMLTTPVARMLTSLLAIAIECKASRVTIGFPPSIEVTEELKEQIRLQQKELHEEPLRHIPTIGPPEWLGAPLAKAFKDSVGFRPRNGMDYVPFWYFAEEQWHRMIGVPTQMFPYVVTHAADRLVALNATRQNPQPVRWIEYSFGYNEREDRSFVEVDLVIEENGSLTIEFPRTRTERYDVRVSRYAGG